MTVQRLLFAVVIEKSRKCVNPEDIDVKQRSSNSKQTSKDSLEIENWSKKGYRSGKIFSLHKFLNQWTLFHQVRKC
jgi:hypothetical protein